MDRRPSSRARRAASASASPSASPGEGCRVVSWDRDAEPLAASKAEFEPALAQVVDVTDLKSVERTFEAAAKAFGKIDILVNNAGVNGPTVPTWEYPPEAWDRVLAVDLTGVFYCCRAERPAHAREPLRPHRQHRLDRRQGRQPEQLGLLAPPRPA